MSDYKEVGGFVCDADGNRVVGFEVLINRYLETGGDKVIAARLREGGTVVDGEGGQSDQDLRDKLGAALRAIEPGYQGIDAVYPDEGYAVYVVAPDDNLIFFQRDYTLDDDGAVTLDDEKVEVAPVQTFEPVAAKGNDGVGTSGTVTQHVTEQEAALLRARLDAAPEEERGEIIRSILGDTVDGDGNIVKADGTPRVQAAGSGADEVPSPPSMADRLRRKS